MEKNYNVIQTNPQIENEQEKILGVKKQVLAMAANMYLQKNGISGFKNYQDAFIQKINFLSRLTIEQRQEFCKQQFFI